MFGLPTPAALDARPLVAVSAIAASAAGLAAPPAADARRSAAIDRQESRVVRLVNRFRGAQGLPAVQRSRALSRAANLHSRHMITRDFFSHTSPDGTTATARIRRFKDARAVGEVLAWVRADQRRGAAQRVVSMWTSSPSHRSVLLAPQFRRIGVARRIGEFQGRRAIVFTADLSSRR